MPEGSFSRQTISYGPMGSPTVLYLHGFASSPAGRKVTLLRGLLEPRGYRLAAPDLNKPSFESLDFEAMVAAAVSAAAVERPVAIVGSSLGALVALAVSRRGGSTPLLLLAPALGFGQRWMTELPQTEPPRFFHHGFEEERAIHRKFFESMASLNLEREPPEARVTVIMGRKDESVPFQIVESVWCEWVASGKMAAGARFVEIPEGDHGLVDFVAQIAGEIEALLGDPTPLG
jgi:pimeloyl-ACP methyl ester carboxylesterase